MSTLTRVDLDELVPEYDDADPAGLRAGRSPVRPGARRVAYGRERDRPMSRRDTLDHRDGES